MKRYLDEDKNIVTEDQLRVEFARMNADGENVDGETFWQWVNNCQSYNGGTLTKIKNGAEGIIMDKLELMVEELRERGAMWQWVIDDIMDDAIDNYGGNKTEQIKSRLEDILHGGGQSGTISRLTYTSDCVKFFNKFADEIGKLIADINENLGENVIDCIKDWDKLDPFCSTDYNKNLIAWFCYEEIAREFSDRLEEEEE